MIPAKRARPDMIGRRARALALLLLSFCLGLMVVSNWIRVMSSSFLALDAVTMFPVPLLGGLLTFKKPRQPIGWLMLVIGTAIAGAHLSYTIGQLDGISAYGAGVAQVFNHLSFALMVGSFGLVLALFPTGQVASPRWRFLLWTPGAATVLIALSGTFGVPDDQLEARSPLGIEGAGPILEVLGGIGLVLGFLSIIAGGLSVVARARSGDATERAQVKWFAFAVGALVALMLIGLTPPARGPRVDAVFEGLLLVMVGLVLPGCLAVAVLKHRLYDIDLVVNRTLVYSALTAVLVTAYAGGVLVFRTVLDPVTGDNDIAIAASTLAVAALFGPARRRIQAFIDRRFYRSRYDAQQTLEEFASGLRDEVDLAAISNEMLSAVYRTLRPAHAAVVLLESKEA